MISEIALMIVIIIILFHSFSIQRTISGTPVGSSTTDSVRSH